MRVFSETLRIVTPLQLNCITLSVIFEPHQELTENGFKRVANDSRRDYFLTPYNVQLQCKSLCPLWLLGFRGREKI